MNKTIFAMPFVFAALVGCHQESKPDFDSVALENKSRSNGGIPPDRLAPAPLGGHATDMTPVSPPGSASTPKANASAPVASGPARMTIGGGTGAPVVRGPGGPAFPPEAKADETASGTYKSSGGTSVEVEGICKISEDEIQCWKPDGSAHEDLAGKIKAAIERQQPYGGSMGMNIQYGKKNRLVVFKVSQPTNSRSGYVNIQNVGSGRFGGGFGVSLDEPRMFNNSQPFYIHYETRSVAEEKSANSTTARLTEFVEIPDQPTLENKVGAKVTFGGERQTLASIKKGSDQPVYLGNPDEAKRPVWTLILQSNTVSKRPVNFTLSPTNLAGQPIMYVDDQGNPMSDEEYRKAISDYEQKMRDMPRQSNGQPAQRLGFPHYGPAVYATRREGNMTTVILRVDPAKIGKFVLHGGTTRYIDLTGIPLK